MAHVLCRLDNYSRHTIRIIHKSCSSTAIMVTPTRLIITLYVHCTFCLFLLSRFVDRTTNCCETVNVFLYLFTTVTVERTCTIFRKFSYQRHKQCLTTFLSILSSFLDEIVGIVLTVPEEIFYICHLLSNDECYGTVRVLFTDLKKTSGPG